jgi:large subunit ribosomal protein L17
MKHRIKGRKFSRNTAHRKALLRNLSIALLQYETIKTTLPKAKELRPFVEKLLTISRVDTLANRRLALSIVANEIVVAKLFNDIGPRVAARNGGYTRILKFGFRAGDKAPMALMELVDKKAESEVEVKAETTKPKKVTKKAVSA